MPNIGAPELIIILIVALIVVGPGKLPDVGSALGKSIREFRKAATDVKESTSMEPAPAQAAAAAPAAAVMAPPTPAIAAPAAAAPLDAPAPTPVAAAVAADATVAEASTPAAQPPTPDA